MNWKACALINKSDQRGCNAVQDRNNDWQSIPTNGAYKPLIRIPDDGNYDEDYDDGSYDEMMMRMMLLLLIAITRGKLRRTKTRTTSSLATTSGLGYPVKKSSDHHCRLWRSQNLNDSAYMDHPKDHSLFAIGLPGYKYMYLQLHMYMYIYIYQTSCGSGCNGTASTQCHEMLRWGGSY